MSYKLSFENCKKCPNHLKDANGNIYCEYLKIDEKIPDFIDIKNKTCMCDEYIKNVVKPIQEKSKIWQILRSNGISECILNVGMMTDAFDRPYQYNCNIFGYEINFYSTTKHIEVFKKVFDKKDNNGKKMPCNLHYYFYCSENAPAFKLFSNKMVEQIPQNKLAVLANKNWAKSKNFCKNKKNLEALKEMKRKYIKCLEYHKQIKFYKGKYISYDYYKFLKTIE